MKKPDMDDSWYELLKDQFTMPYMNQLRSTLEKELKRYKIFPPMKEVFNAFKLTPFYAVKVIILGQDPYHNPEQAHGLSFSVLNGEPPPSLQNIFKELMNDLQIPGNNGDLSKWAEEGVFLLNSFLTVRVHQAASHQQIGWEIFTDHVIKLLSERHQHLVFLLWGSFAGKKSKLIDSTKHHIITSVHPSPLSAHRGFIGSRPFSKVNQYLTNNGIKPIDWCLE